MIWCVGAEHGWRKWSPEFLAGLGKPRVPSCGKPRVPGCGKPRVPPEALGCELQAGKRERGVPRVRGHLVMTHISFWDDVLPGCP